MFSSSLHIPLSTVRCKCLPPRICNERFFELNWIKYMINISYYMYLGFFNGLWVLLLYRSFLLLLILVTYSLIYFRYILALVHVYYIIHFVGDLVNISDNSLIFNWQPLQNHATYLLTEMKKKSFRSRLYLFPWAKYPIFLNIKSPKQKQKNKINSTIFFLFFIIEYCKTNIFTYLSDQ